MSDRYRVGIVGLQPGRSWASIAHLPALRAMSDRFEIAGVANSSAASAKAAAEASGIARAFASVDEMVGSPDVDIVAVTVKVPHHRALVTAALEAGKHVFCEWPLGNGLREAEELAALAKRKKRLGVVGMQARVAPEVLHARKLVAEGFVGEVLSTTLTAFGGGWGPTIATEALEGYLLDRANGATMLSIPVGHTLAAVEEVLGKVQDVSSVLANHWSEVTVKDTGKTLPKTAHDQVLVSGTLASGAPIALHYRGGQPRTAPGLVWEINGTRGDLRIRGPFGHAQLVQLTLEGATDTEALHAIEIPDSYREGLDLAAVPGNVGRLYARMAADLRDGTHTAPTFDDAVSLHRLLEAIEVSAETGKRVSSTR